MSPLDQFMQSVKAWGGGGGRGGGQGGGRRVSGRGRGDSGRVKAGIDRFRPRMLQVEPPPPHTHLGLVGAGLLLPHRLLQQAANKQTCEGQDPRWTHGLL